jgi:hypothetical protein
MHVINWFHYQESLPLKEWVTDYVSTFVCLGHFLDGFEVPKDLAAPTIGTS